MKSYKWVKLKNFLNFKEKDLSYFAREWKKIACDYIKINIQPWTLFMIYRWDTYLFFPYNKKWNSNMEAKDLKRPMT